MVEQEERAAVIWLLDRLTRAGLTAAAKATAPQERTEKTVEKRISTERWR